MISLYCLVQKYSIKINTISKKLYQGKILLKGIFLDINSHEKKVFSQNGEDGIIEYIFSTISEKSKFFVEIGVWDGLECNTRNLMENKGWNGIMIDSKKSSNELIKNEFVTAENVEDIFTKHDVPNSFDLLSIDIDFNDYWVWKAITNYQPRLVIIEYNSSVNPSESKVVKYDPNATWDGTNYFGASLLALVKLGFSKNYILVGCDSYGINAFFVKKTELIGHDEANIFNLYKPPRYGKIIEGKYYGHPASKSSMIEV